MTEEQAIAVITTDKTFIKTAGVLGVNLQIKQEDAQHLLLTDLWEHRYHGLQNIAESGLTSKQQRDIIFSRKDIERATFKRENADMAMFVSDHNDDDTSLIDNLAGTPVEGTSYSEEEIKQVLVNVPNIFRKANHEFVTLLLTEGEEATKEILGMTTKQFNNNMKQLERSLSEGHEARKKADRVLISDAERKLQENKEIANTLIDLVEAGDEHAAIKALLEEIEDNPFFDPAWDKTKYPVRMIREWNHSTEAKIDGYKFMFEVSKLAED